jgi:hypothetical protein
MRLGRRPGAFVKFVDATSEETILKVECCAEGQDLFSFRLYDKQGLLILDAQEPTHFPAGLEVRAPDGELLLQVPVELGSNIQYRLYSSMGVLITWSDGCRTQIFPSLRVSGNKSLSGRPPARRSESPSG